MLLPVSDCLYIAFLIGILIPQEGADGNYEEPSARGIGGNLQYFIYVAVYTLVHHAWLCWKPGSLTTFGIFLMKTLLSAAINMVLIIITELLLCVSRNLKQTLYNTSNKETNSARI